MKVDWNLAPEWANYAAMSANGDWHWFENEPIMNEKSGWWINDHSTVVGKCQFFQPHKHWKNSLTKRKEENDE